MSDLDRAVAARIAAHRPDDVPPFDQLRARRRQRSARGTAAGAALVAAAVLAAPVVLRGDQSPVAPAPGGAPDAGAGWSPVSRDRAAYDRWRAKGWPNYTMRFERTCFCPALGPLTVTVHNRKVVRRAGLPWASELKSIDDLFALILSGQADRIDVTYDPQYGFPRSIDADMVVDAIDDEVRYRISDYRPLPG
jgi:hypothetical protein